MLTSDTAAKDYSSQVRSGVLLAALVLPIGLVCLIPRLLTLLVATALRLMRRPPLDTPLSWSGVLQMLW